MTDNNSEMDEEILDESRPCPYCGQIIQTRPYWAHVANEHPDEYENSQSAWLPLYQDYTLAGMELKTILLVMSELFNMPQTDIESFLIHALYNEKIKNGMPANDAKVEIGTRFGKSAADLNKRLK